MRGQPGPVRGNPQAAPGGAQSGNSGPSGGPQQTGRCRSISFRVLLSLLQTVPAPASADAPGAAGSFPVGGASLNVTKSASPWPLFRR